MLDPKKLKALRVSRCLSMRELGRKIGVSDASISYWESGQKAPAPENIKALIDLFACAQPDLLKTAEECPKKDMRPKNGLKEPAYVPLLTLKQLAGYDPTLGYMIDYAMENASGRAQAIEGVTGCVIAVRSEDGPEESPYTKGTIVYIDTESQAENGFHVAAMLRGERRIVFRRFNAEKWETTLSSDSPSARQFSFSDPKENPFSWIFPVKCILRNEMELTLKSKENGGKSQWKNVLKSFIPFLAGSPSEDKVTEQDTEDSIACRLGGEKWTEDEYNHNWLITGKTGSGKSAGGIMNLLKQAFLRMPAWGGLIVDTKGDILQMTRELADKNGRTDDIIAVDASNSGMTSHRFNLIQPEIPRRVYAKLILDKQNLDAQTAKLASDAIRASLELTDFLEIAFKPEGGNRSKCIEAINNSRIRLLAAKEDGLSLQAGKSLETSFDFMASGGDPKLHYKEILPLETYSSLASTDRLLIDRRSMRLNIIAAKAIIAESNGTISGQAMQTGEAAIKTLEEILSVPESESLLRDLPISLFPPIDEIEETFCAPESTFSMKSMDRGSIIHIEIPHGFENARRIALTVIKQLFYIHALSRLDDPDGVEKKNQLLIWADDARGIMVNDPTCGCDKDFLDKLGAVKACAIFAMHSPLSLAAHTSQENMKILMFMIKNQIHFKTDEKSAEAIAESTGLDKNELTELAPMQCLIKHIARKNALKTKLIPGFNKL